MLQIIPWLIQRQSWMSNIKNAIIIILFCSTIDLWIDYNERALHWLKLVITQLSSESF